MITSALQLQTRPNVAYDPDRDVLGLIGGGDVTAALRRLMQRHGPNVYRYCREALRDAALADDVHQQVFIQVFRDLPRFRGRTTVRVWLFAIARHRVLDAARARCRARAYVQEDEAADVPDPRPSPDELVEDVRLRAALAVSVDELDEHVRTAMLLRYQQGFTYEEMAEICCEKADTLRTRVARALLLLRARIESRLGDCLS
jgi:RNA polymerase sigma-70 factor (ECF subfamily)